MKKVILSAALAMSFVAAQAQQVAVVDGTKFADNWSIGLKGGVVTPMTHHRIINNSRGAFGINLQKQIIPAFGIGFEGEFSVNTSSWYGNWLNNAIDHQYVGTYGALNLMNLFGGYTGAPRTFEMEAIAGAGWLHSYTPGKGNDANSWATKVGLNFNFNLGATKAWTIGIKPAILWNMGAKTLPQGGNLPGRSARYDANAAALELMAGVTYHFKNANGTHSFVLAQLRDQAEIDGLNAMINGLRNDLENCNANNAALQSKINSLQAELDACKARPVAVQEVVDDLSTIRYIFFNLSSSYIQNNQKPNLELVANSLKQNEGATVSVKGYASPEGSKAFNQRLSVRRAEAVKKALVNNYKIDANKINAEGCGVGDVFSVPSWNRVAIIKLNK